MQKTTRLIELDELQTFLKGLSDIPMEPLSRGSALLQSSIPSESETAEKVQPEREVQKSRQVRYLDVANIYEACAAAAYPTVALYPFALRKAAGDTFRSTVLYYQNLHKLLPRAKKKELLNYMEASAIRSYETNTELDTLIAEYCSKILGKTVEYSVVRGANGKQRYRVVLE